MDVDVCILAKYVGRWSRGRTVKQSAIAHWARTNFAGDIDEIFGGEVLQCYSPLSFSFSAA